MSDETVTPPVEKLTMLSALKAVGKYLSKPEKTHAIAVALGMLSVKSVYGKALLALILGLLGVQ